MENTHITKKTPTYIEIKQSCFIYLCNRICECHPKSGTRLALDISLYVIDNSLIGNKQQLLISGRKKLQQPKSSKIDVKRKIDYRYIAMKMRPSL